MKQTAYLSLLLAGCITVACNSKKNEKPETEVIEVETVPTLTQVWETDTTSLITPESVLYDPTNDIFYVSCINGVPPTKKDNDGYIAKLDGNGNILNAKWATGFSAPKGMALVGDTLYVTDISRVVMVNTKTGKTIGSQEVKGATFLNDMDAAPDGTVYFTDSDNHDAYAMKNGKITHMFKDSTNLNRINGVFVDGDNLVFSSSQSGDVVEYSLTDKTGKTVAEGIVGGDGVEKYNDGYFVSNWDGEVYYLAPDWAKTKIIDTKNDGQNSADIEVIPSKNLLVVPTFFGNKVVAYRIE